MKKQILCVSMLVLASLALPSMGGSYNYGNYYYLNDGSWTLAKSGLYWDGIFISTLDLHQMEFKQNLGYGEDVANRGAYMWTASEGEAITKAQFYWWRSGDQADFKAALFTQNIGDVLDNATIAWSTNAGNVMYADGSQTVDFPVAQNVKSIGFGFVDVWSATGCGVLFNTITVETAPAPKHIVSGTVARGGFTGDLSDIGVKVEFAQNGSVVKTAQVFLNANGSYSVPEVVEGTYDVTVKGGFWFKKTFTGVVVLNDTTIGGITLVQGDLNADAMVDVGDLGILAANYGSGSSTTSASNFSTDYAKAFGTTVSDTTADAESSDTACTSLGLPLVAGLALMGLMLVKLDE
jgi:hypothetical protein